MKEKTCIRLADSHDQDFLWEMLYQSIFVKPGLPKPDRKILESPDISQYVENWGKTGDYALIAQDEAGRNQGAIWLRYFNSGNRGYGYISEGIPELGMAVDEQYRGNGLGTILLKEILERTKNRVPSISLSVQADNPAIRLYRRFDFYEWERDLDSIVMRYDSHPSRIDIK
jgi:ribosomal protein S18 acetylase RimI-like enzyme